jgi:hypothetical protein
LFASLTTLQADDLSFDEIAFVKRKPYSSDHYYTDINNGTSADRFVPDNGIYIYNLRARTMPERRCRRCCCLSTPATTTRTSATIPT